MSGGEQLSLGIAFIGFIFLFFLVFCLYFSWGEFFSSVGQKTTNSNGTLEESPEWRAFLNRRTEIEQDPTLDEQSKRTLIENWQTMAAESKPHMIDHASTTPAVMLWGRPGALPSFILLALVFAGVVTYSIGAINAGAFKWPSPNSGLANAPSVDQAIVASEGHPGDGVSLDERLAALNARLQQQPDDLRGWVLLARTHASMSNYQQSAQALQKALALTPGHPDILADLADMTAMAQGRQLAGEPEKYIAAALQSDPRHEKALALAASAAEQAGDQDKAQVYWQLLSQVQQASLKNTSQPVPEDVLTAVTVTIPATVLKRVGDSSALFVFLKAQAGPGMPLAVVRVPASRLIAGEQVVRMGPGDFIQEGGVGNLPDTVHIQARLSIQGMAQTGAGDIESAWRTLARNQLASGVELSLPDIPASP
mgnify:CR=1 FL=1